MRTSQKIFRAKLARFAKTAEEEGKGSGAPPGWGKFREEKLKGRKVPNPDRDSSRKEVTVETAMRKSPAVKKKVMEEYKRWREQDQDKQDKGSKGTKSTKDSPSKAEKSKGKSEKSKGKSKGPNKEFDQKRFESKLEHLESFRSDAAGIAKMDEDVIGDEKVLDQVDGYGEDHLESFSRDLANGKIPKGTDKKKKEIKSLVESRGVDIDVDEALSVLERQFYLVQNRVFSLNTPPDDEDMDAAAAAYAAQTLLDAVKHVHSKKARRVR